MKHKPGPKRYTTRSERLKRPPPETVLFVVERNRQLYWQVRVPARGGAACGSAHMSLSVTLAGAKHEFARWLRADYPKGPTIEEYLTWLNRPPIDEEYRSINRLLLTYSLKPPPPPPRQGHLL